MDFWILITTLGNSETYIFLVAFVYFIISRKIGWKILLLSVLTGVIVQVLKDFFKITRPPKELWKIEAEGYSFPSGHSAGASSFWSYLALNLKNKLFYIISAVIILLVAVSRVILGVHYIQDIIVGILLGLALALIFYFLDNKIKNLKEEKKNKTLAIGTLIIIFLSPYLIFKLPLIGSAFLGFGLAHVFVHFLNLKEQTTVKKRILNFILSVSIMSIIILFSNKLFVFVAGFLACFFPQALWYFIDKCIKK